MVPPMARPLRVVVPGGWYHVVNRGNRRERIVRTDDDRRRFLGRLAELPTRFGLEVHAFVLMDNHYHLLIRLGEDGLSRAIQWLQLSYSVRFNWAHRVQGHVFQGRFKAVHIQHESEISRVARYLHLNPVRVAALGLSKSDRLRVKAGDIADPGRDLVGRRLQTLDGYQWSSWQVYGGRQAPPTWLTTSTVWRLQGGRGLREWKTAVRVFTEEAVRQGHCESPWKRVIGGTVLGDDEYAKDLLARGPVNREEQTEARALARVGRISWEDLVSRAERERGEKWEDLQARYGDWTRDAVLHTAVRHAGYRLSEVYHRIAGLKYQAAAQGVRRIDLRRSRDRECDEFLRRMTAPE